MGTEILPDVCYSPSPSNFDRPFRIHVQDRTFLIDAECMRKISPVFSVMCYGKDFEKGRELSREIVDEKCADIDVFLRAVHDPGIINVSNFSVILRLSHKYQVLPVIEACQDLIKRSDLYNLKPDEVMTLLITAYDFHCKREVLVKLIHRLASEGNAVFARLKISRFLPAQLYGAVISTSLNMAQLREYEGMNGHCLKMERSKIRWRNSVCEQCKAICDRCATCDECKKSLCIRHVQDLQCVSNYGKSLLTELKNNIVELEWDD
uniref:BTB domain-containing protein n=1 Tax=Haemonchus contortus TaxID=6289 RepID=A0A7I4Y7R8_HAECO|nr:Protein F40H3.1, isoform a [Haemonchus contortus]